MRARPLGLHELHELLLTPLAVVEPHFAHPRLRLDERRERGTFKLEDDWQSKRQYVELQKGTGKIVLPFIAGEVNLVMQPGLSGNAAVTVLLDGKPVGAARGADVGPDGVARFDRSGMIRLVDRAPRGKHVLTLVVSDPGLRAFSFTFGP
ncbi:MAG: hypothetical protein ACREVR_14920 [Burkholderiales bacterium]